MKFFIAAIISAMAVLLSIVSLKQELADRIKLFAVSDKDEIFTSKNISKTWIIIIAAVIAVSSFGAAFQVLNQVSDPIGVAKMMIALLCMVGAACFDYREHRIPNVFPAVLAVSAVILLIIGLLAKQNGAMAYITTSVVASIACAVVLFLAALLTKQGLGAGDIKLISALALMTGVYSIISTLFISVVTCSVFAFFALILKRKTTGSAVPFGPFLLLGYIVTVFMKNF